jgi:hypothetical protein
MNEDIFTDESNFLKVSLALDATGHVRWKE